MPERVLIIDDEENIREMIRLALEAAGYAVGEAGSGLEAFAVIGGDDRVLWNDGNAPANGRLTLKGVDREALEKAARKEVSK